MSMMTKRIFPLLAASLIAFVVASTVPAQGISDTSPTMGGLPTIADSIAGDTEPSVREQLTPPEVQALQPFGSNLFEGGFSGERDDGLNPDYLVVPGDQITLRIWGAVAHDQLVTVDAQGNIFVPEVGPVRVAGVRNAELTSRIERAVRSVFTQNVNVYVNLEGTSPVVVFVTGYVDRPGSYAGVASDSLLYFLSRAGGVDLERGSFRRIKVLRGGELIAESDLYDFVLRGDLPQIQFRDGDTVLVERRGSTVTASGEVRNSFVFEVPEHGISGMDMIDLARPTPAASHVTVFGSRSDGPHSAYLSITEFTSEILQDGDLIQFESDQRNETIVVDLEGSHIGPSRYVLPTGTSLLLFLDHVAIDPELADAGAIYLRRKSVAKQQKQSLEESLRRLETTVLGASSQTDEESQIRLHEAQLITEFVKRAREAVPQGVLVVSHEGTVKDLRLQANDVVHIPPRARVVLVNGEVMAPQALVHTPGDTFTSYITRVGGFTERADRRQFMVKRRNGEVIRVEESGKLDRLEIKEGDEIIVLPKLPTKNLQVAATLSQILFQLILSAATVGRL